MTAAEPVSRRVSVIIPAGVRTSAPAITEFARHVEDVGLDGVFVGDHLAPVVPQPDTTLVLAVAAAATERIAIGFSVMIPALRGPAWAAKQIATLQLLSGDRVVLGVGAGGELHGRAAWDAVGVPYEERGRHTDAALRVLPDLVGGTDTTLASGTDLTLAPGAAMPPVWVGGMGGAALRRTVAFGTAWFPSMLLPEQLAEPRDRLRALASEAGRAEPTVSLGGSTLPGRAARPGERDTFVRDLVDSYGVPEETAGRILIDGDADELAARFSEFAEAGVEHLVLGLVGEDWRGACERLAEARALIA